MIHARRLISSIGAAVVFWLTTSFAAVMLGAPHAGFWTSSLMWALLASLLLFPALLMAWIGFNTGPSSPPPDAARPAPDDHPEPFGEDPPRLWPTPQRDAPEERSQENEWPYNREDVWPDQQEKKTERKETE